MFDDASKQYGDKSAAGRQAACTQYGESDIPELPEQENDAVENAQAMQPDGGDLQIGARVDIGCRQGILRTEGGAGILLRGSEAWKGKQADSPLIILWRRCKPVLLPLRRKWTRLQLALLVLRKPVCSFG